MVEEKKGLMEQMDALVRDHLPEKVGHVLREELERLKKVEEENSRLKRDLEDSRKETGRLAALGVRAEAVDKKKEEVDKSSEELQKLQVILEKKEAVLDAVTMERNCRVADMKELVAAVFSNNRFKYTRTGSQDIFVPPHTDSYGCYQSGQTYPSDSQETVEGEGGAPPISSSPGPSISPVPPHQQDR
jgi:hypothetical protein